MYLEIETWVLYVVKRLWVLYFEFVYCLALYNIDQMYCTRYMYLPNVGLFFNWHPGFLFEM
jgi:hypothetical protein